MRILHVIPTLDPAAGGPPVVVTRLAAAQAQLGHRVTIVSYEVPGAERRTADSTRQVPGMAAVDIHLLPPGGRIERLFAIQSRRWLNTVIETTDLLHLHGVWDPIIRSAAKVAMAHQRPYVVAPHGMLDPWSMSQRRWKKRIALALGYRKVLNGAAFLHALNKDEAELISPLGLRCPVNVIPNGVFLEELLPLPERGAFRRAHPALQDAPFVLFLSRLHFKKGLDYLIAAFAALPAKHADVNLVIAGPDGGALAVAIGEAEALRVRSRVHFVGPVYGEQKVAALVDADCFCLPSRQEGFSVAVTEALACGVPVVISRACHFPEVAERSAGRIVDLDAKLIAGALDEVLSDAPLRERMGHAGREMIAGNYTWPRIAELTLSLYRNAERSAVAVGD